jgi:hypothetical protein
MSKLNLEKHVKEIREAMVAFKIGSITEEEMELAIRVVIKEAYIEGLEKLISNNDKSHV